MNRLSKIAFVVAMFASLLASAAAEAGIFRRCRHRACRRHAECEPYRQDAPAYAKICRVADMMHHDGFCDYYCVSCPELEPLGWQGEHGLTVGGCDVAESCLTWYLERGGSHRGDLQDMGYRRLGSADELLEWEETPDFTTTNPKHRVANVSKRYVKYEKQHKTDIVFAQATSFDYSTDAGVTWHSFTVAFQIKNRGASHTPENLGKAQKGKEHTHKVRGLTVLTHKNTLDRR